MTEVLKAVIEFGFSEFEINRIETEVMQGNIASVKVLAKTGFKNEGILRQWMYWNDKHYDMTIFHSFNPTSGLQKITAHNKTIAAGSAEYWSNRLQTAGGISLGIMN